jgi:hypothetical protein
LFSTKFLVFYEPFKWDNMTAQRGVASWVDMQESPLVPSRNVFRDYQQTTFNYSLFDRSPTAIPLKDISPIYTESYMKDDSRYSNGEWELQDAASGPGCEKTLFLQVLLE